MNSEAQDLRDLARKIEAVVRDHRANSIAWEQTRALCDYLTLRAKCIEQEAALSQRELERT